MNVTTKLILAGAAAVTAGVILVYEFSQVNKAVGALVNGNVSPQEAYNIMTSNPISQFAASQIVKSQITAVDPSYSTAQVIFTNQPVTNLQNLSQTQPTIIIGTDGIGTYNPLPSNAKTTGTGSLASPYSAANGYQGAGWYAVITGNTYGNVMYITSSSQFSGVYG